MAALASLLPQPVHAPISDDEEEQVPTLAVAPQVVIPVYGQRQGWRPSKQADFADGGAYPECHIAQYPLDMGKTKANPGNTLALQVDSEGNVRYDAIAQQGHRDGRRIQSQFKDLVPLAHRTDLDDEARSMERPSEEEVQATADRTRAALEKLVHGKIKAAQPKSVPDTVGKSTFVRYTPSQQNGDNMKQRIIKISEVVEDPMEPPRFKHKKIPRGPPSPPPPILRSPPRKATAAEQKEWMIPPCISNWKNNKGFTIPLDKRLAADGRGLQDVHINDNFAKFSESLFIADRHAREEVRQRSLMQQKLVQKEKAAKEEQLREMAQRARAERGGLVAPSAGASSSAAPAKGNMSALAGYGSGGDSGSDEGEDEDEEGAELRDQMRREKRHERERELRMNNMGTEQRAKQLARQEHRDISEKVALGLAKPTLSKESMLDSRLFNQQTLSNSFADEDSYNLYDKPLFHGSSAAAAIYKSRGNITTGDDSAFGGGTEEGIKQTLEQDRFNLGASRFEGASEQEVREGPVMFEKDTTATTGSDVFGVGDFLDAAKRGEKRGLDTNAGGARKKQQLERVEDTDYSRTPTLAEVKHLFKAAKVVPDLLPVFKAVSLLYLSYPQPSAKHKGNKKHKKSKTALPGRRFAKDTTETTPEISLEGPGWPGAYVFFLLDPDAPSHESPKWSQVRPIFMGNLTLGGFSKHVPNSVVLTNGTAAVDDYMPPAPPAGSGSHRYVALLYAQPADFDYLFLNTSNRQHFNITEFSERSGLGTPLAGTFMTVKVKEDEDIYWLPMIKEVWSHWHQIALKILS